MEEWQVIKEKGNAEFKNKNYSTAIDLYTTAIQLNPEEETLFSNRSICNKSLGRFTIAKKDLEKALNINPVKTKNLKRLVNILTTIGHLGESIEIINKCINLEPKEYSH